MSFDHHITVIVNSVKEIMNHIYAILYAYLNIIAAIIGIVRVFCNIPIEVLRMIFAKFARNNYDSETRLVPAQNSVSEEKYITVIRGLKDAHFRINGILKQVTNMRPGHENCWVPVCPMCNHTWTLCYCVENRYGVSLISS
jgi:hypothetical protein